MGTAAILGGSAIVGGLIQREASKDAAKAQQKAAEAGISEQQAAREAFEERTQPFLDIGLGAGEQLQNLLSDPMQGLEQINPMVDFLRQQGFEQIQESAAARGRLGAGGTLKDLTEFNTQLTSTIVPQLQNQRFNQLFNVLGLGANTAAGQGTAGLQTASNISNLLGAQGAAKAGGQIGQANAITGTLQNLAGTAGAFPNLIGSQASAPSGFSFGTGPIQSSLTPQNILGTF